MEKRNKKRRLGAWTSVSSSAVVSDSTPEPSPIAQFPDTTQKTTAQQPPVLIPEPTPIVRIPDQKQQTTAQPPPIQSPTKAPVPQPKVAKRFCQFCKNHGLTIPTLGHKKRCEFRFCVSSKCKCVITREKHRHMARQVASVREKKIEIALENLVIPRPKVVTPKPDVNTNDISSTGQHLMQATERLNSYQHPQHIGKNDGMIMWERILSVVVKKGYRLDTYPLLYILLKEVTNDVEELCNKIAQTLLELRPIEPLIVQAMTRLEGVAAAHSNGVPVLGYQYWVDGFDLRHTFRMRHGVYSDPDHEGLVGRHARTLTKCFECQPQLWPSEFPLSDRNNFPATTDAFPFYCMSQDRNVRGVEDRAGEFIFSTRTHLSEEGFTV